MEPNKRTAGIDGCRAGWLAVTLDRELHSWELLRDEQALETYLEPFACVLIDIPMGLSEAEPVRMCDMLLRRVLGSSYASSVFSPPVRAAFLTTDYKAACDINEAKTGKRISKQAWNIMPKIRQVDDLLARKTELINTLHESHPELLFRKLNRSGGTLPKKKTDEGIDARKELLYRADRRCEDLFAEMREALKKSEAKDDDLLDALILGLMASQTPFRPLRTLPVPPPVDSRNIPMAVHFV